MADNILNATITADGSNFTKTLAQLEKQLKAFQAGLKTAGNAESFSRLNRAADATRARIEALKKAGTDAGGALGRNVVAGSNQASNALTNLGRIAQDAPFGFIGIQNNINPLLESFQRLKVETGSTGGALKALGSSLAGGAGLGLAVSVVTGLLTVFSGALFGAGKAAKESEEELKAYQGQIEAIGDSVERLGQQQSFDLKLAAVNNQVRDFADQSKTELLGLQQQFTETFVSINAINKAVNDARTLRDKISSDTDLPEDKRNQAYEEAQNAYFKLLDKQRDELQKQSLLTSQIRLQQLDDQKAADDKAKQLAEKAAADREKQINDTIKQAQRLADRLSDTTVRNVTFDTNRYDTTLEQYRKAIEFLNKASGPQYTVNFKLRPDFLDAGKELSKATTFFAKINVEPIVDTKTGLEIKADVEKAINDLTKRNPLLLDFKATLKGAAEFEERMKRSAEDFARNIQGAFQNAFVGLAEGIGEAIASQDLGGALFSVLGDLISQIGKALIQYGIVKAGLDKILAAGIAVPGLAAIALGASAVAIGALIKNTRVKGQRAVGGPVTAGGGYLVGERGPELFFPNSSGRIAPNSAIAGSASGRSGRQEIFGQFRVSGNDLIAVVANASRSQRRLS